MKKRRGGRPSQTKASVPPWAERMAGLLVTMEPQKSPRKYTSPGPAMAMTLRDRRKNAESTDPSPTATPVLKNSELKAEEIVVPVKKPPRVVLKMGKNPSSNPLVEEVEPVKKLPRVILKVGRPPSSS